MASILPTVKAELSVEALTWSYADTTNVVDGVLTASNSKLSVSETNITSWYLDFSLVSTSSTKAAVVVSTNRDDWGAADRTVNINGELLVVGEQHNANSTYSDASLTYSSDSVYRIAFDGLNDKLYLIDLTKSNYASLDLSSDVALTENFTAWTNGGKEHIALKGVSAVKGTDWTVDEFKTAVGAVPEPTTATLSLMALGALALRRRRA